MTFPFISPTSRLQQAARAKRINLKTATNPALANLYRETLLGIYQEIYQQELDELAKNENFLRILGRDVREILNGLNDLAINKGYRDVLNVSPHLENARSELAVALLLFDDTEEANAIKRIRGRVRALSSFGQILSKVILYWPKV